MAAPGKPRKRLGAFGGIGDAVAGAPLVARVVAAVGVLAVLIALAFAIVLFALGDLRQSTREQVAAKEVATATLRLERLVDELEQSLRGYVLTRNAGILGVWDQASAQVPDATKQLEQLVAAQPGEAPLAANLDSMITSYVDDYGVPLIAIAKLSPSAALSSVASREGLTRIGDIRRRLSRLLSAEDTIVSAHAASANSSANRAIVIGSVALGASAVVLLLVSAF